jgi:uncharacterized protein YwgA
MERLSYSCRCALVVELVKRLRARGSWCGETHLQKAVFIIQDLTASNFGYKFIVYKHGPYSFEFNSDLNSMHSAEIVEYQFPRNGYGPTIIPTTLGERVLETHLENISEYNGTINFLANWFANNDVRYLEKIATAYYVTKKNPRDPSSQRAKTVNALKPHVDMLSAEEAVRVVDDKRRQAKLELDVSFA